MGLKSAANCMGPPALKIAGFQLWIQGRQFPDSQDYWDGNWLNVVAHCGGNGASVWASGAIIMVSDLAAWMAECDLLYQGTQSEAVLRPLEPNLLATLRTLDRMGHILLRVEITPDHMTQMHRMDFEIDQSYLPPLIEQCNAIVEEYPIRGQAGD
jgi:hypothetical protein